MNTKTYINKNHEDKELEFYADAAGKKFLIKTQDDVNKLFGKIRRLKGRNEIRKNAIKIAVKLKLNIDPLLDEWDDVETEDESFSLEGDSTNFSSADFRYIPKEERAKIPDEDFGYVDDKGLRRLYPILDSDSVKNSLQWLDKLNWTEEDKLSIKDNILKIAKRKKLEIPEETFSEDLVTVG